MAEEEKAPYDASDPKTVKDAIRKDRLRDKEKTEVLGNFMSSKPGRKWFYDLLIFAGVYHTPYSRDAIQMSFNCGEMNVGLMVLSEIENAAPDLYLQMIKENKNG